MKRRLINLFILMAVPLLFSSCAQPNEPAITDSILEVDQFIPTVGHVMDMFLGDSLLYCALDQAGFAIYQVETRELVTHFIGDIDNARLITAEEENARLFLYDRYGSPAQIRIYDISQPADPQILPPIIGNTAGIEDMRCFPAGNGSVDLAFTRNDAQFEYKYGNWDGFFFTPIYIFSNFSVSLNGFDLDDDYIYLAYEQLGLNIVDRYTGASVSITDTPGDARNVKIVDNTAFICDRHAGIAIMDVTDRQNPQILAQKNTTGYTRNIDVEDNYLAVSSGGGGVYLYDISDLSNPVLLDRVDDAVIGYTYRVLIRNGYVIAGTRDGITFLKINL